MSSRHRRRQEGLDWLTPVQKALVKAEMKRMCDAYLDGYVEHCDLLILTTLAEDFGFGRVRLERFMRNLVERHNAYKARYMLDDSDWGDDPENPYKGRTDAWAMKRRLREWHKFDYDEICERLTKNEQ